jgi:hypothetical protein
MEITSTVVVAPEHLSARLGSETVVLGIEKGVYFGLDEIAASVWDRIQTPAAIVDLRDSIVSEYEVDPSTCERDLVAFLSDLADQGMILVLDATDP